MKYKIGSYPINIVVLLPVFLHSQRHLCLGRQREEPLQIVQFYLSRVIRHVRYVEKSKLKVWQVELNLNLWPEIAAKLSEKLRQIANRQLVGISVFQKCRHISPVRIKPTIIFPNPDINYNNINYLVTRVTVRIEVKSAGSMFMSSEYRESNGIRATEANGSLQPILRNLKVIEILIEFVHNFNTEVNLKLLYYID